MKRNFKYICGLFIAMSAFSCKKSLDINTNPNTATAATVDLVLPTAIVSTANNIPSYNSMGAQQVGYFSNSGGVSGWGGIISYRWQTDNFATLWSNTFDVLQDVQYVLDNSKGNAAFAEFEAAAKVLKAYNFMLLVDTYNDVPYSEANQGDKHLQPKYDKAADIYKNIAVLLDEAVSAFKGVTLASALFVKNDPLYAGSASKWAAFAQTLKLKLMVKGQGKVTFANTSFDAGVGFITDDAIVQPVYAKLDGKQNRMWNSWAYSYSGTPVGAASQYAVTPFIMSYYNGNKLKDDGRIAVTYKNGATTPVNQLGYQEADAGRGLSPSSWFIGTSATVYGKIGILKGPDAGQPIMLAAESYFLQAEADVRGILTSGNAKIDFEKGVTASFNYLYKDNTGTLTAGKSPATDFATYKTNNNLSFLVNFDLATSNAEKLEAIGTQKYIAFNMLFGHEAWNEYRRTGFPKITGTSKTETFVSIVSESTALDKLPTRIQYPSDEFKYNAANVPTVNVFSDKIFWAK
ncbi:SusD/RagB family nutrient-binding outer membrane lipoprotein [Pedobacter sp. UBA4863]|uniref:SusD/RagB family nutrient-binding outer membrane lipoprotein n=1 Tax=Pedobacter sp. UBA4863 TaxID=1947060 RepID=UPI0025CCD594|nr:SusD/RagB family nutrient-binding outer membrane lipoprotein [Pedobacter sp. UBA4863]